MENEEVAPCPSFGSAQRRAGWRSTIGMAFENGAADKQADAMPLLLVVYNGSNSLSASLEWKPIPASRTVGARLRAVVPPSHSEIKIYSTRFSRAWLVTASGARMTRKFGRCRNDSKRSRLASAKS